MAPTYDSGAFLQQCFVLHPLRLSLKRLEQRTCLVLACASCNMVHRVMASVVTVRVLPASQAAGNPRAREERLPIDCLATCASEHPAALVVREMDVLQDSVGLRCGACRRLYDLGVSAFETQQR